jgi:hypothetical protein
LDISKPTTAKTLSSTQTMPTEKFGSKQTQTGSVRSKQTQTAETLGSTQTLPTETFFSSKLTTFHPI